MSVPADKLMELMRGQRSAGAALPAPETPAPGMSGADVEPMASPMSTPEPKMGSKEAAMINIGMAMDLIEQALPAIGSESDEGQKAIAAIRALTGLVGPRKGKVNELQQSEILQMLQSLPQAGGATPEGRALAAAPIPGMAPPGMPPGGGMPAPGGMPQPPM